MAKNTGHDAGQRQVQSHVLYDWQSGQFHVEESVPNGSWKNRSQVRLVKRLLQFIAIRLRFGYVPNVAKRSI